MFFILANIVFATLFTLCIKWVQVRGRDDMVSVGMINYIVGALIAGTRHILRAESAESAIDFDTMAALCGTSMGVTYFINFFFAVITIRVIGASAATVIGSLSIVVPILVAALIWGDVPNGIEVIGIALAIVALALIGTSRLKGPSGQPVDPPDKRTYSRTLLVLIVFFILCGNARLSQEAFKHVSSEVYMNDFMIAAFGSAAIPAVAVLLWRRRKITWNELAAGIVLGSANLFQSDFILLALDNIPGYVVFPLVSAGGLVLTTLVATLFLGERLTPKAYLGIAIATVALVFLKLLP